MMMMIRAMHITLPQQQQQQRQQHLTKTHCSHLQQEQNKASEQSARCEGVQGIALGV